MGAGATEAVNLGVACLDLPGKPPHEEVDVFHAVAARSLLQAHGLDVRDGERANLRLGVEGRRTRGIGGDLGEPVAPAAGDEQRRAADHRYPHHEEEQTHHASGHGSHPYLPLTSLARGPHICVAGWPRAAGRNAPGSPAREREGTR